MGGNRNIGSNSQRKRLRNEGVKVATAQSISQVQTAPRASTSTIAAAVLLAFFGLSLVWLSGFANADTLHNAAHDSRHSLVFPCH
jgi:cobalt transporter subunit CbtB